jgi:preprotein translocase subunit SecG
VSFLSGLLNVLLVICSIFMICLVLIQRGRGGGLAGAFGGAGGSSAFGTKAGDVFTRVTIITAGVWFLLAMILVFINNQGQSSAFDIPGAGGSSRSVPITPSGTDKKAKGTTPLPAPASGSGPAAPAPDLPAPIAPATKSTTPPSKPATGLPDVFPDEPTKSGAATEPGKTP